MLRSNTLTLRPSLFVRPLKMSGYAFVRGLMARSPTFRSVVEAAQNWAENSSGFKQYGLRREDLIMEDLPGVEEALRRIPRDEYDRRAVRIRMAVQADATHSVLPKDQWTDGKKDAENPYLIPTWNKVLEEIKEKDAWNNRL